MSSLSMIVQEKTPTYSRLKGPVEVLGCPTKHCNNSFTTHKHESVSICVCPQIWDQLSWSSSPIATLLPALVAAHSGTRVAAGFSPCHNAEGRSARQSQPDHGAHVGHV